MSKRSDHALNLSLGVHILAPRCGENQSYEDYKPDWATHKNNGGALIVAE
jgi:hypothetical protein